MEAWSQIRHECSCEMLSGGVGVLIVQLDAVLSVLSFAKDQRAPGEGVIKYDANSLLSLPTTRIQKKKRESRGQLSLKSNDYDRKE